MKNEKMFVKIEKHNGEIIEAEIRIEDKQYDELRAVYVAFIDGEYWVVGRSHNCNGEWEQLHKLYNDERVNDECVHEWVIDDSMGGEGRAYCLMCGEDGDA